MTDLACLRQTLADLVLVELTELAAQEAQDVPATVAAIMLQVDVYEANVRALDQARLRRQFQPFDLSMARIIWAEGHGAGLLKAETGKPQDCPYGVNDPG